MIRLILFVLILFIFGCSKSNNPLTPISNDPLPINQTDSLNVPFILNSENYFGFSISADSLTTEFRYELSFDSDSLIITLHVTDQSSNYGGYGSVSLETIDSLKIYRNSFPYDRNDSGANIFGYIPYEVKLSFRKYTGDVYFIVSHNNNLNILDSTGLKIEEGLIYYNSFENLSDISHFDGYGTYDLNLDVPLGGGSKSLYVSGGCFAPHVYYNFPPADKDGYYLLQCWGKTTNSGGDVSLRLDNRGPFIKVDIRPNGNIWNFYKSVDTLYCPQDSIMQLRMMSGGPLYRSMLVDLVQIVKVK